MDFNIFYISGNSNECSLQAFSNVSTKPEFMTLMSCDRSAVCVAYMCSLEQLLIDDAVDQRPARLRVCVRANGGHF